MPKRKATATAAVAAAAAATKAKKNKAESPAYTKWLFKSEPGECSGTLVDGLYFRIFLK